LLAALEAICIYAQVEEHLKHLHSAQQRRLIYEAPVSDQMALWRAKKRARTTKTSGTFAGRRTEREERALNTALADVPLGADDEVVE